MKNIEINSFPDPWYQYKPRETTALGCLHTAHCYKYFQKKNCFYFLHSLSCCLNYTAHLSSISTLKVYLMDSYFYSASMPSSFAAAQTRILDSLEAAFSKLQFSFRYFGIFNALEFACFEYYYFHLKNAIKWCFA